MPLFSGPQRPSTSVSPNDQISEYTHITNLDRSDEALRLLHQIASAVKPIMRKRNWRVGTLAEFLPDNPRLQGPLPTTNN
jgi:DNA-dependent metalloprotease WSS1